MTTKEPKLPRRKTTKVRPLFDGAEWTFDLIRKVDDACREVAIGEMGLDIYPNQIEVITAEQMLDSYSSIGMPLMYRHWSFGKRFARDEAYYKRGMRSLAYELVINSDPCISYVMEENSMTMQTLVIAHAAYGHNHFFKNNYQFRMWTQPDHIIDYLSFAKSYVAECEEKYGESAVEATLDAAHALMNQGVSRDLRPRPRNIAKREKEKAAQRRAYEEATFDPIYRTLPDITRESDNEPTEVKNEQRRLGLPEENLLYFLEKNAPKLADWQRELLTHRAPALAVFLPAAPDQDDERGLRHLRPLQRHEHALRARPPHRRNHAGVPALALVGHLPASLQQPPLLRHQPLCAWLRHDERHPAHLHRAQPTRIGSGSPTSPAAATGWAP